LLSQGRELIRTAIKPGLINESGEAFIPELPGERLNTQHPVFLNMKAWFFVLLVGELNGWICSLTAKRNVEVFIHNPPLSPVFLPPCR
jgi:hypothetical protein